MTSGRPQPCDRPRTRRAKQMAHFLARLELRHGIRAGAAGAEALVAAIEAGQGQRLTGENSRGRWYRVMHWTGRALVVCFDPVTRMVTTVLTPGMALPPPRGSRAHDVWTSSQNRTRSA